MINPAELELPDETDAAEELLAAALDMLETEEALATLEETEETDEDEDDTGAAGARDDADDALTPGDCT